MASVYLGLGSNIEPEENLRHGIRELRSRYGELQISDVYKSTAVGFSGADFLNLVVGFDTDASPASIHEHIEIIHHQVGRERGDSKFSSRPLDIDLLLYDELITDTPVQLPRPDVLEYSFVLRPLSEIAPDLLHPQTGRTMAAHWQEYDAASHPLTLVRVIL